jgi:hypothetical protein
MNKYSVYATGKVPYSGGEMYAFTALDKLP